MKSIAAMMLVGAGAAGVSAFAPLPAAPVKASRAASSLRADASSIPGKPFGPSGPIFDPLGLAARVDDLQLKKFQECEVKHGRVAMLATVGFLVQEHFHPLFPVDYELGPALTHFQMISKEVPYFWVAAVFAIGVFEADNIYRGWQFQSPTKGVAPLKESFTPGDLDFDPLKLAPKDDPEKFFTMRTKEINNGRLAMIAIIALWAQELVNGQPIF